VAATVAVMAAAHPSPEYQPVVGDSTDDMQLTAQQVAHEAAMAEVEETLLNIEHTIRRADRAYRAVASRSADANLELALKEAVGQLEATRKTLFQATYFSGDQQRLI